MNNDWFFNTTPGAVGILDKSTNTIVDAFGWAGGLPAATVTVIGTLSFVEGTPVATASPTPTWARPAPPRPTPRSSAPPTAATRTTSRWTRSTPSRRPRRQQPPDAVTRSGISDFRGGRDTNGGFLGPRPPNPLKPRSRDDGAALNPVAGQTQPYSILRSDASGNLRLAVSEVAGTDHSIYLYKWDGTSSWLSIGQVQSLGGMQYTPSEVDLAIDGLGRPVVSTVINGAIRVQRLNP